MISTLNKNWDYYPQVFSKVCKCIKRKVIRHNIDDLESSSDDFDEEKIKGTGWMYFEDVLFEQFWNNAFLR